MPLKIIYFLPQLRAQYRRRRAKHKARTEVNHRISPVIYEYNGDPSDSDKLTVNAEKAAVAESEGNRKGNINILANRVIILHNCKDAITNYRNRS